MMTHPAMLAQEESNSSRNKVTLENLNEKIKEGQVTDFNVIIKGDVQGSVEALTGVLEKLSTSEIKLNVIRASAGAIIESDITLASASNAVVIGCNGSGKGQYHNARLHYLCY